MFVDSLVGNMIKLRKPSAGEINLFQNIKLLSNSNISIYDSLKKDIGTIYWLVVSINGGVIYGYLTIKGVDSKKVSISSHLSQDIGNIQYIFEESISLVLNFLKYKKKIQTAETIVKTNSIQSKILTRIGFTEKENKHGMANLCIEI